LAPFSLSPFHHAQGRSTLLNSGHLAAPSLDVRKISVKDVNAGQPVDTSNSQWARLKMSPAFHLRRVRIFTLVSPRVAARLVSQGSTEYCLEAAEVTRPLEKNSGKGPFRQFNYSRVASPFGARFLDAAAYSRSLFASTSGHDRDGMNILGRRNQGK